MDEQEFEKLRQLSRKPNPTGGDITYLAWAAYGAWCDENPVPEEDESADFNDRSEAYAQACADGWLPPWERDDTPPPGNG